jgi:hypothetical protein
MIASMMAHPAAWLGIVALGFFHGINPGMGWLFAVSNGMQEKRSAGVLKALPPLAFGHFLAMAAILLPVAALQLAITHQSRLRVGAAVLLMVFGIYKLLHPRHPRYMARIGPSRLTLWSFLMATAHGAGLMLIPIFLIISNGAARVDLQGHTGVSAFGTIAESGMGIALLSVLLHTLAMIVTAGVIAWLVYRYLGLRLLQKTWFNLDLLWAVVLIVVGVIALVI